MYGKRFTNQFGAEPNETWRQVIGELSNEQIQRGFNNLRAEGSSHPPSLTSFEKWCNTSDGKEPLKIESKPYDIREAQKSAIAAGCDRWDVEGKSMDELWAMEIKARYGHTVTIPDRPDNDF